MIDDLSRLRDLMRSYGVKRLYAKPLAPNDNSKNQIYLGGDFSALNILPHGEIVPDGSVLAGSKRDRAKASLDFWWIDEEARRRAPNAKLILYPRYPEVRLSGFLKGCEKAPGKIMASRDDGRLLFVGVTDERRILAFATRNDSALSAEFRSLSAPEKVGVFTIIPMQAGGTRGMLLAALRAVHDKNWIVSQKLSEDGRRIPYSARNGGGYTLEAELGIRPNGRAEPDFLGWEVKQYAVTDLERCRPKGPITLMTPEPTSGFYKTAGVETFIRRFGYADKSGKADRLNFGGVHVFGKGPHHLTGLRLDLLGFEPATSKIIDIDGGIALLTTDDEVAAFWSFSGLIEHWTRKHAQAGYVPSIFADGPPRYAYGDKITLCEGTDFGLFIAGLAAGHVYFDPGIKMENASSSKPKTKKRSQFRIAHKDLGMMYRSIETVQL